MDYVKEIIKLYNVEITFGLTIFLLILLVLYLIAEIRISKLRARYDKLTQGIDGINLEELLFKNGEKIDGLQEEIEKIHDELKNINTRLGFAIQKVGFVRYNAFADMGSELSFSIVFLDEFLNGFVLTSIYGRDQSMSYAKPIKGGKSAYPLSAEEIQAIDRAIKGENYSNLI